MDNNLILWNHLPNRDEALFHIFEFLRGLSKSDLEYSQKYVQISDIELFKKVLDEAFRSFLMMVVEDKILEEMMLENLSFKTTVPTDEQDDAMDPTFSNNEFTLQNQEIITLKLFLNNELTPVRVHFRVEKINEDYFLKIIRITAD